MAKFDLKKRLLARSQWRGRAPVQNLRMQIRIKQAVNICADEMHRVSSVPSNQVRLLIYNAALLC